MEWNEKLQQIIDYIENHLQRDEEPIDVEEISSIAGCSFSFFQKVFSYMNGISFAEYIRYRKLTLAGYDLKSTDIKVVDLSYKYGYESPTSFTKAFQQFHGVSPKQARENNVELQVYPKMNLIDKHKYTWKLESKKEFRLAGKKIKVSCLNNTHYSEILKFWSDIQKDGTFLQLISMDEGDPMGMFGMFGKYDKYFNEIEYSIMVISNQELPQGFVEYRIPEVTWAIFDCRGAMPQAIQRGWKFLNEEWIIKYPFKHAKCPEFEWYSNGNVYDPNYLSQIWIPILDER
ncbi:AraC family transcriptional regulator [Thomasclavelia sp.]